MGIKNYTAAVVTALATTFGMVSCGGESGAQPSEAKTVEPRDPNIVTMRWRSGEKAEVYFVDASFARRIQMTERNSHLLGGRQQIDEKIRNSLQDSLIIVTKEGDTVVAHTGSLNLDIKSVETSARVFLKDNSKIPSLSDFQQQPAPAVTAP